MIIRPLDRERLRAEFNGAKPFRWLTISPFLDDSFAREVIAEYPSFEQSRKVGREFSAVNEQRKVQITNREEFPPAVRRLSDALASREFLEDLEYITGIPKLRDDPGLEGGGMHMTGARGRLDVHVDFNLLEGRQWHRRLNILVYLNPEWDARWGGEIELWDREVKHRHHAFAPELNRCVIFETSNISFHGVSPVTCPPDVVRKSFAAYYYTAEPPVGWTGDAHSTVFRARPHERLRGYVLMPLEDAQRRMRAGMQRVKHGVKKLITRTA